jgi:large subunit ribosomal protein L18
MRRGRTYRVAHRRRREGKTDYRQRLSLLRSGKPRFIVRKSLNNIVCQIVEYERDSDKTRVNVYSDDIKKSGWKGHCGNLPAAYLTGLLCGTMAKKHNISEAVMDMGLQSSTKGSGIYAALKGALDAGLKIPHSDDILPTEDRITGKHAADYKKDSSIVKNFEQTKASIISGKAPSKTVSKPATKTPAKKTKKPGKK